MTQRVGGRVRQQSGERSRAATAWVTLGVATLFLILLVDFVAQNGQRVSVHFLGANGHASLAVMLLIAAVGGAAVTLLVGSVRILQLRRRLHVARTADRRVHDSSTVASMTSPAPAEGSVLGVQDSIGNA